jgi:hypothetical protein
VATLLASAEEHRHADHELRHEQGTDLCVLSVLSPGERPERVTSSEQVRVRFLEPAL